MVLLGAANPHVDRLVSRVRQTHRTGFEVIAVLDNDPAKHGRPFAGSTVVGGFETLSSFDPDVVRVVNLITGSTAVRCETSRLMRRAGFRFANLIDPDVDVSGVELGAGCYVQEHVSIESTAKVDDNAALSTACIVCHEVRIGASAFVGPGACIAGVVDIGDGAFVGANATVLPRLRIGRFATVGAGAVVTRDVPDGAVVVGNPARVVREVALPFEDGRLAG